MTVGIASICHRDDQPHVLLSADRMVTFGRQAGIEYEDTEPKLCPLIESDSLTGMAMGSGVTTVIDEILRSTQQVLDDPASDDPTTVSGLMRYCLAMYQSVVRDTINNQVLAPLGYQLTDLKDSETDVPPEIQKFVANRANNIKEQMHEAAQILVAGVGEDGPELFHITGMDYTNYTNMGYAVIGSGSDSARLTFIRRRYGRYCEYAEGVFTILDAKSQAEERQGVGQQMDLVALSQSNIHQFDTSQREELRKKLKRIEDEERNARQNVMNEWNPTGP